jgi:HEAT repeat protein
MKKPEHTTRFVLLAILLVLTAVVAARRLLHGRSKVSGENPSERAAAVYEIAVRRPAGAAAELARVTRDASKEVRVGAIAALAHVLRPDHRPLVVKGTADPDPHIRAVAAGTLSVYGDTAAADVLIRMIEADPDEHVVKEALRGVARCKDDPRAIVALMGKAEHGRSNAVKMAAMNGLLRLIGGRVSRKRHPEDEVSWRDLIQGWKTQGPVTEAYAAAGVPLIQRPQDRISGPCRSVKDDRTVKDGHDGADGRTEKDGGTGKDSRAEEREK